MERIFAVNVKYGKLVINPAGIKAILSNNAKANKQEPDKKDVKVKTK